MRFLLAFITFIFLCSTAFAQDGTRLSDRRINKMYDTTKVHRAHKRRNMTMQIGDSTRSGGLQPTFALRGWRGEAWLRINLRTPFDSLRTHTREESMFKGRHRVRFNSSKVSHDIRTEDWGVIWDMILSSKPDRNVFRFRFRSHGLTFTFQDTLTDIEKSEGAFRPDSVIGSYAIYHSTKSNNRIRWLASDRDSIVSGEYYGTGKFGHIFRPKAWDSSGDTVWCRITIDTILHVMRLRIPQAFLNRAVYPVTVDPDVGFVTKGGTEDDANADRAHAHSSPDHTREAGSGEEVQSITVWTRSAAAASRTMELAVYKAIVNGSKWEPTDRLTSNIQIAFSSSTAAEVSTSTLSNAMVSGTRYTAAWGEFSTLSGDIKMYWDADVTGSRSRQITSDALGVSWNHSSFRTVSRFSVYFTYGAATGGDSLPTRRRRILLGQ